MPTAKVQKPPLFRMRIFAPDVVSAKSRFWYFMALHKKLKKTVGEIVACSRVRIKKTSLLRLLCLCFLYSFMEISPLDSALTKAIVLFSLEKYCQCNTVVLHKWNITCAEYTFFGYKVKFEISNCFLAFLNLKFDSGFFRQSLGSLIDWKILQWQNYLVRVLRWTYKEFSGI